MLEYIRIACAVPPVKLGDVKKNTEDICDYMIRADQAGVDLVVFPELAMTGYTCADLFFQDTLRKAVLDGLRKILSCSGNHPGLTAVVGAPLSVEGQLYNCGVVVQAGRLLGIVPKTYLPNYGEFYERRWFSSSVDLPRGEIRAEELGMNWEGSCPVGRDLLFRLGDGTIMGVEICEDLWTAMPPSTLMALNGAEVVVNLSASNETVGKRGYRRDLVRHQSSMCTCIYAYCSAGCTESTQDLVFSGHSMVAENGHILGENENLIDTDYLLIQDADLGAVRAERRQNKSVRDAVSFYSHVEPMRTVGCGGGELRSNGMSYPLNKMPFVPANGNTRLARCREIFSIQVAGLKQRLRHIGANAVVGVSGGLDSTLALLVAVEANRQLGRGADAVYGVTLPCYGTSDRTYRNALALMELLGVSIREINIRDAVALHFRDIGHDPQVHNATYENSQARERTQILMDYASTVNGIVVGTGDLSELALGWCTYNGDQMSMYGVNAGVPKTLIPGIIWAVSEDEKFAASREVLKDIIDTPISPELLPPDAAGNIAQQTEDLVGPYALHDFFLFYVLRMGYSPTKIYTMACRAFRGEYAPEVIKKWLGSFYRRFFTQQFKRNAMPDGVKVGSVSLNPRGDWRMPSDASARIWLDEVATL